MRRWRPNRPASEGYDEAVNIPAIEGAMAACGRSPSGRGRGPALVSTSTARRPLPQGRRRRPEGRASAGLRKRVDVARRDPAALAGLRPAPALERQPQELGIKGADGFPVGRGVTAERVSSGRTRARRERRNHSKPQRAGRTAFPWRARSARSRAALNKGALGDLAPERGEHPRVLATFHQFGRKCLSELAEFASPAPAGSQRIARPHAPKTAV
jgi:hypothetical protein